MTKYDWAPGMPFLPQFGGGKSFPQVFSAPIDGPAPAIPSFTDDVIFGSNKRDVFQIVALLDALHQLTEAEADIGRIHALDGLLNASDATFVVHGEVPAVCSTEISTVSVSKANIIRLLGAKEYTATGLTEAARKLTFKRPPPLLYDPDRIREDLGFDVRYVIVRWDRFVFAACKNGDELKQAASQLEDSFREPNSKEASESLN